MGSATNACEKQNRMPHSSGNDPCAELETRAGIWRYDANKTGQIFSPKERYATGIRNGEGFDFDTSGRLYVTQHGREQLHEDWPELYTAEQGFELPAEEVVILNEGANYGWPYCYYDGMQKKLVLAPEYGGDGKKIGDCDQVRAASRGVSCSLGAQRSQNLQRVAVSEGVPRRRLHCLPRLVEPCTGTTGRIQRRFPAAVRRQGLRRLHHLRRRLRRSEERAGSAVHRPSGLAVGPDGALYITDDKAGRVWRITYNGDPNAPIEAAPTSSTQAEASPNALPPEGVHPAAGALDNLPLPPGATAEQVALGKKIFDGEVAGGTCAGCHGANGIGTPVGADLASGTWLWGDGSLKSITDTIKNGVPQPKQHPGAMPPYGGVHLSDSELAAVAAYVWAIGHQKKG